MRLVFRPEKCIGCKVCEVACSVSKSGSVDPRAARLRIEARYTKSGELLVQDHVCNKCTVCVKVCPCHALEVTEYGIAFYAERCSDCGVCVESCPRGVIKKVGTRRLLFCDGCNGQPECAKWCSRGALEVANL